VALADRRDAIEAECDRLISSGDSSLSVVGSCKHTKHAQLDSVAALDALRVIKPKKSKKADMFEFEFVVGATARTLDKKRRDDQAAVNSKKTSASVEKAAAAKAAASPSPVAAASPDAAAKPAPASATSSSSGDYLVETTQSVYRELALPSFARALLLGQVGAAAASSAAAGPASASAVNPAAAADIDALAGAAALLTADQQSGLLSRAQLKELKELAPESRAARIAELVGAERLVAALTPAQLESTLPAAARAALRADLLPALESYMIMFANQAYTRGFQAAKRGNGNIDLAALL